MSLEKSIIRRSIGVTIFFVVGHLFNYMYLITANRMVSPAIFGLLYVSGSMITIMATPGPILGMTLAQHFAATSGPHGPTAVVKQLRRILGIAFRWIGLIIVGSALALGVIGRGFGIGSYPVIVLIPIAACASIICELVRSAFQGTQRFVGFGVIWIVWNALHYVFALAGLYVGGTVWAALIGAVLATSTATLAGLILLVGRSGISARIASEQPRASQVATNAIISQLLGYGLFNCLVNADVVLGYLVLNHEQVGIYVASSILPKAIVTATLPVAQVLLPVIAAHARAGEETRFSTIKAIVGVLAFAAVGVFVLRLGGGFVCDTRWGIRYCDLSIMTTLAPAAIALSLLRILVVTSLASGDARRPLLQALALAAMAAIAGFAGRGGPLALAAAYFKVCWVVTVLYLIIDLLSPRRLALKLRV